MRQEFSRRTRRDAIKRADGRCEGVGMRYGLPDGKRCEAPLVGPEFDHDRTCEEGGDNSLENCVVLCKPCHRFKSATDIGRIRKADRVRDKIGSKAGAWKRPHRGLRKPEGAVWDWSLGRYVK